MVRLEIGSGFCGFVSTNDDGGDDDSDDDVWYWLGKSDVDTSIYEDDELVLELLSLITLSKEVSFELTEYCSSPESLLVVIMLGNEAVNHYLGE